MTKDQIAKLNVLQRNIEEFQEALKLLNDPAYLLSVSVPRYKSWYALPTSKVQNMDVELREWLINWFHEELADREMEMERLIICREDGEVTSYTPTEI